MLLSKKEKNMQLCTRENIWESRLERKSVKYFFGEHFWRHFDDSKRGRGKRKEGSDGRFLEADVLLGGRERGLSADLSCSALPTWEREGEEKENECCANVVVVCFIFFLMICKTN